MTLKRLMPDPGSRVSFRERLFFFFSASTVEVFASYVGDFYLVSRFPGASLHLLASK